MCGEVLGGYGKAYWGEGRCGKRCERVSGEVWESVLGCSTAPDLDNERP